MLLLNFCMVQLLLLLAMVWQASQQGYDLLLLFPSSSSAACSATTQEMHQLAFVIIAASLDVLHLHTKQPSAAVTQHH